jgi:hypothetical protein
MLMKERRMCNGKCGSLECSTTQTAQGRPRKSLVGEKATSEVAASRGKGGTTFRHKAACVGPDRDFVLGSRARKFSNARHNMKLGDSA